MYYGKVGLILILIFTSVFSSSLVPPTGNVLPPFKYQGQQWVDSVFQTLSPDERIAQLIMVAAYSNRGPEHEAEINQLIADHKIGGLIFFQGGPARQAQLTNRYQAKSKTPLLIAMDLEWGLGMRLDSTISFPYQMALGALQNDSLIYKMGVEIARQCRRLGVHVNFAPAVDVNNNPKNPVINYRSFGEDPRKVANKGLAYMKGLQDHGVMAVAKHFPGHGDTGTDSHHDLPIIHHQRTRLDSVELYPFVQMIAQGVSGTMIAHMSIPVLDSTENLPSTLSRPIVTDLLKEELSFTGLVFTDALNMKGVTKYFPPGKVEVRALMAGNDVLLFSEDVPVAVKEIKQAIKAGKLSQKEIDQRCKKVLAAKYWAGLSEYSPVQANDLVKDLNTPLADLLNRQLTEASLTLLLNQNNLLPMKRLDTLRLASISIGTDQVTPFQKMLSKYTHVDHYQIAKDATGQEVSQLGEDLEPYSMIITGLHQPTGRPNNTQIYSDAVVGLVNRLANYGSVICSFRNAYTLNHFTSMANAPVVLVAYQDNVHTQELAAQVLFGGAAANGILPVTVNSSFPSGKGLSQPSGYRFKYTIPEEVAMDSKFLAQHIDSIVLMGLREQAYPGAQVLVAKDGKVVYHKTYGFHRYDSTQKVSAEDIYDFASITKVTGPLPALMKLYEEGKLDLDAKFSKYWPDFKKSNKSEATVREVLAHFARFQAWIAYWQTEKKKNGKFKNRTFKPLPSTAYNIKITDNLYLHKNYKKKIYKAIRKSPLLDDRAYVYSGLSFYLYPEIISKATGANYEDYLKNTFYRRLGAQTLTYNPDRFYPLERIIPTEVDTFFRMEPIHGKVHDEGAIMMSGISGNAGLFGTTNDLAKLMQMYLQKGTYGGEKYLERSTIEEFIRCQYCPEGNRRGLGFDKPALEDKENGSTAIDASAESFGHSGYTGTFTWADPANGLLFVFMSNRVYPTRNNSKLYQLNIRPAIHQVIYDALKKGVAESNP